MKNTRTLFIFLIVIAFMLLGVQLLLLFHPKERNREEESVESLQTDTPVILSPAEFSEGEPPVSQDHNEASVTTGTDIYMEFPVLAE